MAVVTALLIALRRVPWSVWALLALVVAVWFYGEHKADAREATVRDEWAAADAAAEHAAMLRDLASADAAAKARTDAADAVNDTRAATSRAQEDMRHATTDLAPCDPLPDRVRAAGDEAVARTRRPLRTTRNP